MPTNQRIPWSGRAYSVRDLLEAREAYHVHLAHLDNVVATAVGLHRYRRRDQDATQPVERQAVREPKRKSKARTLANSVVTSWSQPAILVFVDHWMTRDELAGHNPAQIVPDLLYMPDGRAVPTCVILAEPVAGVEATPALAFPSHLFAGGLPVLSEVQGTEHVGSLGCLVTDGNLTYALTNRHVTGDDPTRELFTLQSGRSK